jgi:hypothetical protein
MYHEYDLIICSVDGRTPTRSETSRGGGGGVWADACQQVSEFLL